MNNLKFFFHSSNFKSGKGLFSCKKIILKPNEEINIGQGFFLITSFWSGVFDFSLACFVICNGYNPVEGSYNDNYLESIQLTKNDIKILYNPATCKIKHNHSTLDLNLKIICMY